MSLWSDAEIDMLDIAYDRAYGIAKAYNNKGIDKNCKRIVVHF